MTGMSSNKSRAICKALADDPIETFLLQNLLH